MKKVWVSILMICYLAVSTGVVINYHYCMNRLASRSFYAPKAQKCGKCGMGMHKPKGCCREEVHVIKLSDDQKVTATILFELPSIGNEVVVPSAFIITSFYNGSEKRYYQNHSPPLLSEQDTYIQNRVFRI
jgi:hypothetical protein